MICCVSRAKIHFEHRKISESCIFSLFFLIFLFSEFSMVLRCSDSQFRISGLISCPGLVSNRPGMKYQAYSNFRVHMLFMCRPIPIPNHSNILPFDTRLRPSDAKYSFMLRKIDQKPNELSNFTHCLFWRRNFWICHFSENLRLARHRPRTTLLAYISQGYMLYESL